MSKTVELNTTCPRCGKPAFSDLHRCDERERIRRMQLVAWLGEDEYGSGKIGLKQGLTPAGLIPLAAILEHRDRMDNLKRQLERQAKGSGKRIYLVRFEAVEILDATGSGGGA